MNEILFDRDYKGFNLISCCEVKQQTPGRWHPLHKETFLSIDLHIIYDS